MLILGIITMFVGGLIFTAGECGSPLLAIIGLAINILGLTWVIG